MAAETPPVVTMSYDGISGDREFVVACKGRSFAILTSPIFPTPAATLVDYNLVRDLKLRISDLQGAKFRYVTKCARGNFAAVAKHSFPSQRCPAVVHLARHSRRDHTLVIKL